MIAPLVKISPIEEKKPTDIVVKCGDFFCPYSTVEPITQAGRQFFAECFGSAACGANFSKTKGIDFGTFAQQKGFGVEFTSDQPTLPEYMTDKFWDDGITNLTGGRIAKL